MTTSIFSQSLKGIETATFEPKDSSFDMKINGSAFGDTPPTDEKEIEKVQRKSDAAEVVIMVKGIALFESNHYKTVIGALHFSEQPW